MWSNVLCVGEWSCVKIKKKKGFVIAFKNHCDRMQNCFIYISENNLDWNWLIFNVFTVSVI